MSDDLVRHVLERVRDLHAAPAAASAAAPEVGPTGGRAPAGGDAGDPQEPTIAVAVSGGGDSVALAAILAEAGLARALLHVDHALRADSADDTEAVRELGRRLGIPVRTERVDVRAVALATKRNLADAARRVRLETLHRLAKEVGAETVALAHTLDDQAETVLLQLLRGAATLRGMAPRRGRLVRPLLGVGREELRAFLRERGLPWRDDPSNDDPASRRARIRHELLPAMEAIGPGAAARLARHALVQRDLQQFATEEAVRRVRGLREALGPSSAGTPSVDARTVAALPVSLQREALALLMRAAGAGVDLVHIEEARSHLDRSAPWRTALPGGGWLEIGYGRLRVDQPQEAPAPEWTASDRAASDPAAAAPPVPELPEVEVTVPEQLPSGVDPRVLADGGPVMVRGRRPGDWIRLPAGRRSVSDVLIDRKVPRDLRARLRVVARGDEVLWIEGVAAGVDAGVATLTPEVAWMRRALELAREAGEAGETPVGAIVVADGVVLGEGRNRTEGDRDPSAHAEMIALRAAARARGDWRLADAVLVVTLEPCPMCFGAVLQAHVPRVVFGARNLRQGALGSVTDLSTEGWKRSVRVDAGVLEGPCRALLSDFFERRRATAPGGRARRSRP